MTNRQKITKHLTQNGCNVSSLTYNRKWNLWKVKFEFCGKSKTVSFATFLNWKKDFLNIMKKLELIELARKSEFFSHFSDEDITSDEFAAVCELHGLSVSFLNQTRLVDKELNIVFVVWHNNDRDCVEFSDIEVVPYNQARERSISCLSGLNQCLNDTIKRLYDSSITDLTEVENTLVAQITKINKGERCLGKINFKDDNHKLDAKRKDWGDEDWINEFYNFLQGEVIKGATLDRDCKPKLSPKQAFSVIWFLQEHFRVLPSNIERCDSCDNLFDYDNEGSEHNENYYCDHCYNKLR